MVCAHILTLGALLIVHFIAADEARAAALVALLTQPPPPILDNSWRIRASAIAAEMQLDKLAQAAERALSAICPMITTVCTLSLATVAFI